MSARNPKTHWFFVPFSRSVSDLPYDMTVTDAQTVHHLRSVMRMKAGDPIVLVDGCAKKAYEAVITSIDKHQVGVILRACVAEETEPSSPIVAAMALVKGQRWDWALQKLTELGVTTIQPLVTERTIVDIKSPEAKHERWMEIVKNASEQSERLCLPEILPVQPLKTWLNQLTLDPNGLYWAAVEWSGDPIQTLLKPVTGQKLFVIGPEGGWPAHEVTAMLEKGFTPVSLGSRVLRTETAAIVVMSLLGYGL